MVCDSNKWRDIFFNPLPENINDICKWEGRRPLQTKLNYIFVNGKVGDHFKLKQSVYKIKILYVFNHNKCFASLLPDKVNFLMLVLKIKIKDLRNHKGVLIEDLRDHKGALIEELRDHKGVLIEELRNHKGVLIEELRDHKAH